MASNPLQWVWVRLYENPSGTDMFGFNFVGLPYRDRTRR